MTHTRFPSILGSSLVPLLIAAASISAAPTAQAETFLSISDTFGDPSTISIAPGESFTIVMRLSTTTEQLIGTTYSLIAPGIGDGKFTLVARDVVGSAFSDLSSASVADTVLTNQATIDLGATVANISNPVQPGNLYVATYTVASNPTTAPGVYTIQTGANSIAADNNFNSIPLPTSSYQVNVVPEPGTAALVFGGLGVLSAFRRRRSQSS